ncbi:rab-like protein 6 isoform X1 [Lepeophtheirus salmonis]|uniref:rab-like protein 6 isoform X1 n=1 Tax=Lepeophtheirus salmonis TaxID=72036 RepID=UPI001AE88059|nr:rab-like protein 6 [Lepeophtheirus salmonis]
MFSAMKKLRSGGGSNPPPPLPNHSINKSEEPHPMSISLQKKFAKGIDYNMKLLLRGDRMTGKSSLFLRLQGCSFPKDPSYTATEEISVASIQWNYKATDDIVKVEVWDVVDRGKKRPVLQGLKLTSSDIPNPQPALDAEFVDVYKGAHGVVILYDMTKSWTFDYVKRELPKIPINLPILILGNFADQCHHRTITKGQALGVIDDLLIEVPSRLKNTIRYAESSMRNGFGLKFLHKFLNLPFLHLQRDSLLTQMKTNDRDMIATHQELDLLTESEESSYESFSENVTKIRRQVAESHAPSPTVDVVLGAQQSVNDEMPILSQNSAPTPSLPITPSPKKIKSNVSSSSIAPKSSSPKMSIDVPTTAKQSPQNFKNVEDFVPESSGIDNFLMDEDSSEKTNSNRVQGDGESSDEEGINHLVTGFDEDVVIDDYDTTVNDEVIIKSYSSSSEDELVVKNKAIPEKSSSEIQTVDSSKIHIDSEDEAFHSNLSEDKRKKKSKSSRKKSEEEERNALEEFLNGIPDETPRASTAYEEF